MTRLHVFNRTEEAVFLIDETGRRLDVPACGEAVDEQFGMDMVQVRTEIGYVFAFGAPAENPLAPEPQFLVLVAEPGESFPEPERPTQLPPCSGRNQSQPGV